MSPARFASIVVFGALVGLASPATAAVTILEGAQSPPDPPAQTAPLPPAPMDKPTDAPPQGARPAATLNPATANEAGVPPALPPVLPVATVVPSAALNLADLASITPANDARLTLEMLPGQTVNIGSLVSFKVTSKKPGYVVLMDVDATGHLTQIYPNPPSLIRSTRANGNYIQPAGSLIIPRATDPYAGVRYVVSPPSGGAMVVAILSALPVQIVDLPDIPAEILGKPDLILAYLSKLTNELRIPDHDNKLRQAQWSFDAKPYTIQ